MKLKRIPARLGFILGAQWTRDLSWTIFTILLARRSPDIMGQIVLALTYGYLVKTAADVGLNDYLLSSFARREERPLRLLGEISWLKLAVLAISLYIVWLVTGLESYSEELRLVVLCIALGLGADALADSFFALCQARGRQDVEMRIRIPAAVAGIGFGILAVVAGWPPLVIAIYKPLESAICIIFCVAALRKNPFVRLSVPGLKDIARKMKGGLVFTGMAACAMFYNKINIIFLKKYGGNADVGGYGVAWETIEGVSVLISSALLGKVIFPLLASLWKSDRQEFRRLSGQTARTLWAASLPLIFLICVESDRFLTFVYGPQYASATIAQQLLTPCLATAFLHNLAAYAMISMQRQNLLFAFYLSGAALNLACCLILIPMQPLAGAALSLTITKVWVAILTVSFFQWHTHAMSALQWGMVAGACAACLGIWWGLSQIASREIAELGGLAPLLALLWCWRPPSLFEKAGAASRSENT